MEWTFSGRLIEWRGPSPYYFVPMTDEDSEDLKQAARGLEYWGQVAVDAAIGETSFRTALFPKDGRYLLPVRQAVRLAEGIGENDVVSVRLRLRGRAG